MAGDGSFTYPMEAVHGLNFVEAIAINNGGKRTRRTVGYYHAAEYAAYADPEYRGQGLAKVVTSAVTAELFDSVDTVVLNVRADNPPALATYRALGYREHTEFEERLVHRDTSLWDSIVGPVRAFVSDLRRNG